MPRLAKASLCSACLASGRRRKVLAHGLCGAHNMRRVRGWTVAGPIRRMRRLSPQDARAVRRRYVSPSSPGIAELAADYGVARVTIWRALRGLRHAQADELQRRIDARRRADKLTARP